MPPPTPATTFTPPVGIKLGDGYQTLMVWADSTGTQVPVSFWIITVKPVGLDGGDPVDTTTMWNIEWHTKHPRFLANQTDATGTAAYDPQFYNNIIASFNKNGTITVRFPDGSTVAFYGYLQKFDPGELKEGEMPTAAITFIATNTDPVDGTEQAPVYVPPA